VYILKHVLHDWDDDSCKQILIKMRENMPNNAKIVVCEKLLDSNTFAKYTDILMMVSVEKGKERTQKDFEELFSAVGFSLGQVIAMQGDNTLLEFLKK